jgi:hypothetical protein
VELFGVADSRVGTEGGSESLGVAPVTVTVTREVLLPDAFVAVRV